MKEMKNSSVRGFNAWKCAAGCFGLCLTDTASPVMDAVGVGISAASANA